MGAPTAPSTAVAPGPSSTGTSGTLRAIDFATPTTGFLVGDGVVLRTTDGGATFAARPFAGGAAGQTLISADCVSVDTCLMTISGGDRLARTTDGGATSTAVSPSGLPLVDAAFASASAAVAVGVDGTTVVSGDAGANFSPVGGGITGQFDGFRSVFGQRAYSPGANGRVAQTPDGGRNWSVFSVSTSSAVADISFPTPAVGFALDGAGTLLRTDNAGESWQILNTGSSANAPAVTALDTQHGIADRPARGAQVLQRRPVVRRGGFAAVRSSSFGDMDRAGGAVFAFGARALA